VKIEWTPDFLRKLDQLSVVSKKVFTGRMKGDRKSARRGESVEFADYRNYVQGDDHRHIDWNAYARFESLFLKLFMEEEDLSVWFLLDVSKSMDFGGKAEMAARITAALGYIGLANLDRVGIHAFGGGATRTLPPAHGKGRARKLLGFLEELESTGRVRLDEAVGAFVAGEPKRGLVVLISDFLDEAGFERPLNLLRHHRYEPVAVQVLAREEVDPPQGGDWRLIDSETGAAVEISLGRRALQMYRARLDAYTSGLERFCRATGVACLRAIADQNFEDLILKYFRDARLVG